MLYLLIKIPADSLLRADDEYFDIHLRRFLRDI